MVAVGCFGRDTTINFGCSELLLAAEDMGKRTILPTPPVWLGWTNVNVLLLLVAICTVTCLPPIITCF